MRWAEMRSGEMGSIEERFGLMSGGCGRGIGARGGAEEGREGETRCGMLVVVYGPRGWLN